MFVCNGWDAFEKRLERFLKQMSGRLGRGSVSALSEGYFPLGLHSSGPTVYVCSKSKARLILSERIPRSFACFCSLVAINPSNWDDPLRWAGGAHFWIISPPRHASHWARTAREGRDAELKHCRLAFPRRKDEGESNPGAVAFSSEMLFTSLGPTLIVWSVYRRNCGGPPEADL